ncbi:MAG: Asp-tRNA(Asn)/Glu-tRNA(Gln) amidotransferase subunit GatA [Phycisphaerales bacterium]|nr:Asp-tRNA(Asn)/Glu-tRNA(Gln) amidotransferase subunit GatA [Phycisphaerales bacterium]MCI0629472.1 Asp-tRNA(Asn)/Glu-tRNA(Gln) amidotransferase subunit GatA [Phycisphaerales bacterium]MCI0674758.1 Asp-tRNA(Asn)/Glu-tRNA(Gln) amidotransferase subunit GatA [Phycisphaerales bacterium]
MAVHVVRECLDRIDRLNPALNAFHEVTADLAMKAARRIDLRASAGEDPGQLAGVPIAVKDNIVTEFGHTTCGSRILENYRSPFSATAIRRLINAGAIIVGKTNCDEFAMGSSTENCAYGPVRNPWDVTRVPGGSSGGSAAAVAAGMCPLALGSETGGSVRQPASMCGVVGVKPSYGRVSRYGLVAFGSSLDQIGPLARTVADAAAILSAIAGIDRHDSTSSDAAVPDYLERLDEPVGDLRIGVPRQYCSDRNDSEVNDAVQNAIELFKDLGATIIDVDLPLTNYGIATYYVIAPAEASSNLARYDGIRYGRRADLGEGEDVFDLYAKSRAEGFGPEVQRRIMLGTYVLSAGYYDAYYKRALQARRLIKQEFDAAFARCHALLGPTSPTPAFPLGSKPDPLSMYLSDIYTVNTNIAGICGISIPCGFAIKDRKRLPIGLHLQCRAFDELTMFRVARMFERGAELNFQLPELELTR